MECVIVWMKYGSTTAETEAAETKIREMCGAFGYAVCGVITCFPLDDVHESFALACALARVNQAKLIITHLGQFNPELLVKTKPCQFCRQSMPSNAHVCPTCGQFTQLTVIRGMEKTPKDLLIGVTLVIVGLVALFVWYSQQH